MGGGVSLTCCLLSASGVAAVSGRGVSGCALTSPCPHRAACGPCVGCAPTARRPRADRAPTARRARHEWLRTNVGASLLPRVGWKPDPFGASGLSTALLGKAQGFDFMAQARIPAELKQAWRTGGVSQQMWTSPPHVAEGAGAILCATITRCACTSSPCCGNGGAPGSCGARVCVCACVRVCACVCVRVCVRVCLHLCLW